MPQEVRTRFAPSPTGYLHIGSLRTALYGYLTAKHYSGKFLLRIEDTDMARILPGALENILEMLQWAGLDWDEGPAMTKVQSSKFKVQSLGNYGPYIQSERLDIYKKYAQALIDAEKAYYCFCAPERLEKMRAEQNAKKHPTRYDRLCRELSAKEIEEKIKSGARYVIRFKTPVTGNTEFNDLIRGTVQFNNSLIDDYILQKSDGFPTYHLASVIDDHLMEISHVIRGEEWLSSAPIHLMLYGAFGWQPPLFAHLPNILGADKKKLSKRAGDAAVGQYIEKGYLSEALINFILLLGWNPGTEKEIFTREEMIKEFTLDKVGKSGAIFDLKKLDWMNGNYIRKMELEKLTELCLPYLIKAGMIEEVKSEKLKVKSYSSKFKVKETGEEISFDWLKKVVALEQERMKKLSDIAETTKYFFVDIPQYDTALLKWKKSTLEKAKENLAETAKILENLPEEKFNKKDLEIAINSLMEKLGVGDTLWPLRVALSGVKFSPSPFEIAEVLGKEKVLKRIEAGIEKKCQMTNSKCQINDKIQPSSSCLLSFKLCFHSFKYFFISSSDIIAIILPPLWFNQFSILLSKCQDLFYKKLI
ncbi:glutamate--tRNA ligase [Patescibacteria group bacterium]|nr:glutamate--tRNA ligase [Patescibacteria group bacterium]MBU4579904.1 glutamate--tRNA ligase [Patescibacteria group bacterium]